MWTASRENIEVLKVHELGEQRDQCITMKIQIEMERTETRLWSKIKEELSISYEKDFMN